MWSCDLAGADVDLDGVVDLDEGVRVADGASVVGAQVGHTLGPDPHPADFAELVLKCTEKYKVTLTISLLNRTCIFYLF